MNKFTRLTLFVWMWGCAEVIHQLSFWYEQPATSFGTIARYGLHGILLALAIAVVIFPHRLRIFVAMVAVSFLANLDRMPWTPNHLLFLTIADGTILFGLALGWWRSRRDAQPFSARPALVLRSFAPALRVELLLLYAFVTIHKLNWDFFRLKTSCASALVNEWSSVVPFIPNTPFVQTSAIIGTLLIEGGIPLLLLFARTRRWGLLVGLAFHTMLGIHPHGGLYSFSAEMFALFSLFTSHEFINRLSTRMGMFTWNPARRIFLVGVIGALAAGIWVMDRRFTAGLFVFCVWTIALWRYFIPAFRRGRSEDEVPFAVHFGVRPWLLWAMPLIVFLNGMSPFLGFKTETALAMFSNLRTESNLGNHVFFPKWLQIGGYQDDLVEIVEAKNHDMFERFVKEELLIPFFEFKRLVSWAKKDFKVTYLHRGERRTFELVARVPSDPSLRRRHGRFMETLLAFRPIDKGAINFCRH